MRKATFTVIALALLALSGPASAVSVRLDAQNQISSGGTLSTLKWKACSPTGATNPCLSTTNAWTLANATPSNAVWDWNPVTGVLSMTGTFQTTSFVSSNANGSPVISDKVTNLVITTGVGGTATAASYQCVEGTFLSSVGANGCLNTSTGNDFNNESSALYNVGGNANCVQRTVGGDDSSTGNVRGLVSAGATGPCEAVDGAFDLFTVVTDNTATGGQLVISNGIAQNLPSSNYLTFTAAPDAVDDGPFNAPQDVEITLDVLANDVNFTDPVTVTVTTNPTKGTAVVTGSPGNRSAIRILYTANSNATGPDSFVYTVLNSDNTTSDTATVTLNTLAFGANDDTASTTRNSGAITINVGANDVGLTNPVTVVISSAPSQGGSATPGASGPAANASVSYTPATTAAGSATYTETFTYDITDANDLTSTGTVTVTVNNSIPVAGMGSITISTAGSAPGSATGTFNAGTLAGNNLGNAPSVVTATNGTKGNTSVAGSVVSYTPSGTFFKGTDSFSYTITDSDPGSPETATNTVNVTINDVSPTITGGSISTAASTASVPRALTFTPGNGSLAQHTLLVSTQATNGSCALTGTSLTYTPTGAYTGPDSCVVTLTDEEGAGQSANATFTITVNAAGGGGGGGGLLPGGGGAVDPWSLALLGSLPLLRRLRARRRAQAGCSASDTTINQ
ncbi:MAG: Ig-like domain-containing protein [Gammaproteobacteria bacterium]